MTSCADELAYMFFEFIPIPTLQIYLVVMIFYFYKPWVRRRSRQSCRSGWNIYGRCHGTAQWWIEIHLAVVTHTFCVDVGTSTGAVLAVQNIHICCLQCLRNKLAVHV